MADMREALRKAGLVSEKQARQARHQERIHRKEVGIEGVAEEQRQKAEEFARERDAKKERDRLAEERRIAEAQAASARVDLPRLVQKGVVQGALGGPKQYFFTLPGGRITFLELSEAGFRRLLSGTAAVVDTLGAVRGDSCVVDAATAEVLRRERPEAIRDWPTPEPPREGRSGHRDRD